MIRMAYNGVKQPLLSGVVNPTPEPNKAKAPNRRRLLRVRSAPLAEFVPPDVNADGSLTRSSSFLGGLHMSISKVAVLLGIYLGMGTMCFYFVLDDLKGKKTNGLLDSLYFCIVTMTTVGYGDLVPDSVSAKLMACVFVFSGMALVGLILSKAADYLVEKQEILLVKALHMHKKVGKVEMLKEELETNKVRYKCFVAMGILSVLMAVAAIFLYMVEDLDVIDCFYCVCSTITTLGYGDKSFATTGGRMFAVFWILGGTLGLGQLFLYITELMTESRRKAFVKWVLSRQMTTVDLEAADMDCDGEVGAAEFVLYKLKEMGKIDQDDIAPILEEFENLDYDHSGTLSASDIVLAQATQTTKK